MWTRHGVSLSSLTCQEHMTSTQSWPLPWQCTMTGRESKYSMIRLLFVQCNVKAIFQVPNTSGQVYKHWYSIQGKVYNDSFSTVCSTITIILFQINSCTWKSIASLLRHLQNKNQKSLLAGLVPRPLPDFILQPWRKIGRRHGIKTRSQTMQKWWTRSVQSESMLHTDRVHHFRSVT